MTTARRLTGTAMIRADQCHWLIAGHYRPHSDQGVPVESAELARRGGDRLDDDGLRRLLSGRVAERADEVDDV